MAEQENSTTQQQASPAEQNQAAGNESQKYDAFFDKLDSILDKRATGLAKSALKEEGVDQNEIVEIVNAWKSNKQAHKQEKKNETDEILKERDSLKEQLFMSNLNSMAGAEAIKQGVSVESVKHVLKLIDKADVVNESGEIQADKVSVAISSVLTDIPAFKKSTSENTGFVKVGSDGDKQAEEADDEALRRLFGLSKK